MNVEGYPEWVVPDDVARRVGLSAMVRLKNEAMTVAASLQSIVEWCDEIVIALQGEQTDGTDDIVRDWSTAHGDKVRVLTYPFDSRPNGPGHDTQLRQSVYERAYFYNWVMSRTSRTYVMKWDGDMVAMDDLGDRVHASLSRGDFVRFGGVEIVSIDGEGRMRVSADRPRVSPETRVFRASSLVRYQSGHACEVLTGLPPVSEQQTVERDGYLHFKWAKPRASAMSAWPDDWMWIDHFQRIARRALPGDVWTGPVPSVLLDYV